MAGVVATVRRVVAARRLGLTLRFGLSLGIALARPCGLTLRLGLPPEDDRRGYGFGRFGLRGGPRGAPAQRYDHEPDPQ